MVDQKGELVTQQPEPAFNFLFTDPKNILYEHDAPIIILSVGNSRSSRVEAFASLAPATLLPLYRLTAYIPDPCH